jgi:hypothetical protein
MPAGTPQQHHATQGGSRAGEPDLNLQDLNWREGFNKTIQTPVGRALLIVIVFGSTIELLRSSYDWLTSR